LSLKLERKRFEFSDGTLECICLDRDPHSFERPPTKRDRARIWLGRTSGPSDPSEKTSVTSSPRIPTRSLRGAAERTGDLDCYTCGISLRGLAVESSAPCAAAVPSKLARCAPVTLARTRAESRPAGFPAHSARLRFSGRGGGERTTAMTAPQNRDMRPAVQL
jgi:hypothetical protein